MAPEPHAKTEALSTAVAFRLASMPWTDTFAPGAAFGFATMVGVRVAGDAAVLVGLSVKGIAAICSLLVGSAIGSDSERRSDRLARSPALNVQG